MYNLYDKTIEVSLSEIEEKFKKEITYDGYAVELQRVAYWRKDYDLEDRIYEQLDREIENCGYYLVTNKDLEELDLLDIIDCEPNDDIFYHEWY